MSNDLNSGVPTDNEVILGILNHSENVLKRLYLAYFPMVLQLIINNNGNEDDAKDIYQEAIIVLYNKVKGGDFELSSKLKTYIYSVCRRLWLKRLSQMNRYSGRRRCNGISPETCSTRRLITKLAPTRMAMPTVWSVSTVG